MGVGPIIVIPQLIITAAAIILSEMGKLYSMKIAELKIPFVIAERLIMSEIYVPVAAGLAELMVMI